MEKIACSNCGTENRFSNKYCTNCGYEIIKERLIETDSQPSQKSNSKKSKIVRAVVSTVMFFITYFLVQHFVFAPPSFDKVLSTTANEINKTCPMMIDQYTRLDNAMALPNNRFQYNYTIVSNTVTEVNLDTAAKYIKPNIINNVRTNPDLKTFRDNDVTLIYNYRDKNGVFVVKYEITPEVYK